MGERPTPPSDRWTDPPYSHVLSYGESPVAYGVVRHPQYAGLMLAIIGALVQWPTLPTVVMAPVLVATYYRLARREERTLAHSFGSAYATYAERVPMLVPRVVRHRKDSPDTTGMSGQVSPQRVRRPSSK